MRRLLFVLLVFFPVLMCAQKIDKNEIDEFTGVKTIYTNWEKFKTGNGLTGKDNLMFRFTSLDGLETFHLKWVTCEMLSIKEGAKLMFKMSDNSIITLTSISYAIAAKGDGVTGLSMSGILGISCIYGGSDIEAFAKDNYLTKLRIYTTDGYVDIDIKEKDAQKINRAYKLMKEANINNN